MKNLFAFAALISAALLSGCGGGGSYTNPFTGSYSGTATSQTQSNESGTSTVTIDSNQTFTGTLTFTNPAEVITFTGSISTAQSQAQEFTAVESGGPFNGQSLTVDYVHVGDQPPTYPNGYYKVFIRAPGSTAANPVNAFVLILTKIGSNTGTGTGS